jgi:hypothetical protein
VATFDAAGACGSADSTVLITSETGVGKELLARALHFGCAPEPPTRQTQLRRQISTGLVESELFGHAKGAESQARLLRVLQEQEFEPVGAAPLSASTCECSPPPIAISRNAFRTAASAADLFFRLNAIPLEVPPLRERMSDITLLALHFLARAARKTGKAIRGIGTPALEAVLRYDCLAMFGSSKPDRTLRRALVWSRAFARVGIPVSASFQIEVERGTKARFGRSGAACPSSKPLTMEEVERAHLGKPLPPLAQVAFQQGSHTARNLLRLLRRKPTLPFRYMNFGQLVSVGHHLSKLVGFGNKLRVPLEARRSWLSVRRKKRNCSRVCGA